jgi:hypothetical protein
VRYDIVRFCLNSHARDHQRVITSFTTLEEAQEYCSREDTHGEDWFDGYREVKEWTPESKS